MKIVFTIVLYGLVCVGLGMIAGYYAFPHVDRYNIIHQSKIVIPPFKPPLTQSDNASCVFEMYDQTVY